MTGGGRRRAPHAAAPAQRRHRLRDHACRSCCCKQEQRTKTIFNIVLGAIASISLDRRRHRDHEHHARVDPRAHQGDRRAPRRRRDAGRRARAVPQRSGDDQPRRRHRRHHRRRRARDRRSSASRRSTRSCRRCRWPWRSACRWRSDSCSASCRRRRRPSRIRSSVCATSSITSRVRLPAALHCDAILSTLVAASPRSRPRDGRALPSRARRWPSSQAADAAGRDRDGAAARAARRRSRAARATRRGARDRAFNARLLPQVILSGNAANLNHGINPITLPDGSTQFVVAGAEPVVARHLGSARRFRSPAARSPSDRSSAASTSSATRPRQVLADDAGRRSGCSRISSSRATLVWDEKVQSLSASVAERQYLEAREDVAGNTADAFFDLYARR